MTVAEQEFMAKTAANLRSIDNKLGRIADALERIVGTSNEPSKTEEEV